jgi:putative flippase GtrA
MNGRQREFVLGQLIRELIVAARFAMVGLVATAVHMITVWLLIESTELHALLANLVAFAAAFFVSFIGHYVWTFRRSGGVRRTLRRWLAVSVSAFAVNTVLLAALIRSGWLADGAAAVLSAGVVPLITFLFGRWWVFRSAMSQNDVRI